jgi:protein SCO1/2
MDGLRRYIVPLSCLIVVLFLFSIKVVRSSPFAGQRSGYIKSLPEGTIIYTKETLPNLNFISDTQQNLSDKDFYNKWSLFFFGYTTCPEFCPEQMNRMAQISKKLPKGSLGCYVVSIDPENDTPAHLYSYMSRFDHRLKGLSGSLQEIQKLSQYFKVIVESSVGIDGHIEHSANFVLLAPDGTMRAIFNAETDPKQIAQQILWIQSGKI